MLDREHPVGPSCGRSNDRRPSGRSGMMLPATPARRLVHGFTLVEVLIAVTLVTIVVAIAMPRFALARTRIGLESSTQRFISDVNLSRTEAIRTNAPVTLKRLTDSTYQVGALATRNFDDGVTFVAGFDSVRFSSIGNVTFGAGSVQLKHAAETRTVQVNAGGLAVAP